MDFVFLKWTKPFVYYLILALTLTEAQDLCSPRNTDKLNYGAECSYNSQCGTNVCSWSRCSCSSGSFYDDCSTSCVPKCGNYLYIDGPLVSPNDLYSQGSTCSWYIYGSSWTYVTLVVDDIDMYSFDCDLNSLTVTDMNSYLLVNKVCHRNYTVPTVVASSDYYMIINYKSAYSGYRGFRGKFYIRSYHTSLSELSGYIASPGFPVQYPSSSNYTWLISGKPGHVVTLSILSLSTQCYYDYVRVYDGPSINSPLLDSLCSSSFTRNITSSTSRMLINFRTDGSVQYTGFSAFYVTHGRPHGQPCNDSGQCAENFICIDLRCGCRVDQYYDVTNQTCLNVLTHGAECSVAIAGMCSSYFRCSSDRSSIYRCLCPVSSYHYLGYCYPESELSVTIATDTVIQTTSIYLKWTTATRRSDVYYTITWVTVGNSTDRGYNMTYTRDTYMTNLKPATEYELTIATILPSDSFYSNKSRNSSFRMETRRPYGYSCSGNIQCDVRLNCIGGKCICLQNQYFQNSTSTCMTRLNKGQECDRSVECQNSLTCIERTCGCTTGQYYHTSLRTCLTVQTFGSVCNTSINGMCRSPDFVCTADTSGLARCLCPNNTYYNDVICSDNIESSLKLSFNQTQIDLSNLIGLTSVNVSWTAIDDGYDRGSNVTDGKVISLSRLTPGQEYLFTVELIFTSDGGYSNNKQVLTQFSTVTLPATPGPLRMGESNLRQPPYTLRFSPSPGFVKTYQIILSSVNAKKSLLIRRVTCPELTTNDLSPDTTYNYEIIAFNKNGNRSAPVTGHFDTDFGDPPVTSIPGDATKCDDLDTFIGLICTGWTMAAVVGVIVCVQCVRLRKITRNTRQNTQLAIDKQIQPRSLGTTFSVVNPVTANDYRDAPKPCRPVLPTSPKNRSARPNSSVYINNSYHPDANNETNDDTYEEIGNVADCHIYNNN